MTNVTKPRRFEVGIDDVLSTRSAREAFDTANAALEAGEAVRALRRSAGLKQKQLAKALSISQARISAIENGEGRDGPSYALLKRIAAVCKVTGPILTFAEGPQAPLAQDTGILTVSDKQGHLLGTVSEMSLHPGVKYGHSTKASGGTYYLKQGKQPVATVRLKSGTRSKRLTFLAPAALASKEPG